MDSQKQSVIDRVKQANNILVTVSTNPTVDQLAACVGLTIMLNSLDKHATAVFSGNVPSTMEFLQPEKTLEKNTDSLRDFIISLDKSKADKLRYKVEDKVVKIFITPYRTSISEKDFEFSQGDFNVEVVLALGVHDQKDIDQAITAHGRILHDATVIGINTTEGNNVGTINWVDAKASSLSEMVTGLTDSFDKKILDNQVATALLTGIVAETDRFSNARTTPDTMKASAQLMVAGANQELVATKLAPLQQPSSQTQAVSQPAASQKQAEAEQPKTNDGTLHIDHTLGPAAKPETPPPPPEDHKLPPPIAPMAPIAPVSIMPSEPTSYQELPFPQEPLESPAHQEPIEPPLPPVPHEQPKAEPEIPQQPPEEERVTAPEPPLPELPSPDLLKLPEDELPPLPKPPTEFPKIRIDDNGNLPGSRGEGEREFLSGPDPNDATGVLPSMEEEERPSGSPHLVFSPPTMGGTLTANSRPEDLDPSTDPLSSRGRDTPLLAHDNHPAAGSTPKPAVSDVSAGSPNVTSSPTTAIPDFTLPEPNNKPGSSTTALPGVDLPPPPTPFTPSTGDDRTLTDLEKAVDSPHADDPDVAGARGAVEAAVSDAGSSALPEPIAALNAQPLGSDLHDDSAQNSQNNSPPASSGFSQPAGKLAEPLAPDDEKPLDMPLPPTLVPPPMSGVPPTSSSHDPSAPPPVPPPMMPPLVTPADE